MAAVIVAIAIIPLMISSTATDFLQVIGRFLRSLIWPKTAQCDPLLWSDMPSDSRLGIHDCGLAPAACLHRSNRTSDYLVAPECWNSTLAIMFNRGNPTSSQRRLEVRPRRPFERTPPEASIPTKLTKNELQNLIAGLPTFLPRDIPNPSLSPTYPVPCQIPTGCPCARRLDHSCRYS